jgi:inositol-phosphate transport system substrate-binding protein
MTQASSRRNFLLTAGGAVAGLVVGGVAGWSIKPSETTGVTVTKTVTQTVTQQVERTVTSTETVTQTQPTVATVTLSAWTQGPERESVYRQENLVLAARKLSSMNSILGAGVKVEVTGEFSTAPWGDYRRKLQLAFESKQAPDIVLSAHIDIAVYSDNGWIISLDDMIKEHWDWVYNDVIESLWSAVSYKGKLWGIPQDTEARPVYFRKDHLIKLGWSEDEIASLPKRVEQGRFTFEDMLNTAAEAVKKNIVQPGYGIWHRPNAGPDWPIPYLAYGGSLYDEKENKLVAEMKVWEKVFDWFERASMKNMGVISDKLIGLDYNRDVHPTVVAGKTTFWFGGTWHKGQWVSSFGLAEDDFWRYFGFMLYPAGEKGLKPVTLSQPVCYMISSNSKYVRQAFLVITMATDPYLNSLHANKSAHLAILNSQLNHSEYKKDRFNAEAGYLVAYSKYQPMHPGWGTYNKVLFDVIKGIEAGQFNAQRAANVLEDELKKQLGDAIIIR